MSQVKKLKTDEKRLAEQAKKELQRFQYQKRIKLLKTIVASSIFAVTFLVVFGLAIGGAFEGLLGLFGLSAFKNEAKGIYADCSLPQNKNLRYCLPQHEDTVAADWQQVGQSSRGGSKFRLTNDF